MAYSRDFLAFPPFAFFAGFARDCSWSQGKAWKRREGHATLPTTATKRHNGFSPRRQGAKGGGWRLVSENTFMRFPRADELNPNQRSTENREHVSRALGALRPPRRCERFCEGAFPKPWFNEKTSLNGREELNCLELMSWERTENHAATQRTTPQELPQAVQRKKLTRRVNDRVHRRENRPSE